MSSNTVFSEFTKSSFGGKEGNILTLCRAQIVSITLFLNS